MVTTSAPVPAADTTDLQAREGHLAACVRTLESRGWQQRLAPLAETLVRLRLVRGRNEHGAPVRRLDGEVLRETMCRLLREGDESAYLVFELLVEGMDPAWVAAERGVSALMLTELLCDAVDALAVEYEDVANQAWTHAAHQGCDRCHHASAAHKRAAGAWRGAR